MIGLFYFLGIIIFIFLSIYFFILISNIRSVKWFNLPSQEGKFAAAGGKKIYYRIKGRSGPVVVIINSIGSSQAEWWHIQNESSQKCRVITIDRPGYGWSTSESENISASSVAKELNMILKFEKIRKPVYIVANGTGVLYARYYCANYPSRVLGVLFTNPLPLCYSDWMDAINSIDECPNMIETAKKMQHKAAKGIYRLVSPFRGYRLDHRYKRYIIEHYSKTEHYDTMQKELSQLDNILAEVESAGSFPPIPLRALYPAGESFIRDLIRKGINEYSARQLGRVYQELSKDVLTLSPESSSVEVEGAGEHIHLGKPNIVIEEIRNMVSKPRTSRALRTRKKT